MYFIVVLGYDFLELLAAFRGQTVPGERVILPGKDCLGRSGRVKSRPIRLVLP